MTVAGRPTSGRRRAWWEAIDPHASGKGRLECGVTIVYEAMTPVVTLGVDRVPPLLSFSLDISLNIKYIVTKLSRAHPSSILHSVTNGSRGSGRAAKNDVKVASCSGICCLVSP